MNKKTIESFNNIDEINYFLDYVNTLDLDDEQLNLVKKFLKLEIYQQNLFIMRSQGQSLRDIGSQLNVSYQWVNQHLKDAYKILKD